MNYASRSNLIREEFERETPRQLERDASARQHEDVSNHSGAGGPRPLVWRDLDERDRILLEHFPQVRRIARRIHDRLPRHVPFDDLVQSGVLGLIEALNNFDPTRNVQLKSFAHLRIQGAILDSLREQDWSPRTLRKKGRQIEQADQTLRLRLARTPSEPELAAELNLSLEELQHLVGDLHGLDLASLQALSGGDGNLNEWSSSLVSPHEEDPWHLCLRAEMIALLRQALAELPPRKRQALTLYHFQGLTMKEVGAALGVGESRVSQIHSAAIARLRVRLRQLLGPRPPFRRNGKPPKIWRRTEQAEAWDESQASCALPAPHPTSPSHRMATGSSSWKLLPRFTKRRLSPGARQVL